MKTKEIKKLIAQQKEWQKKGNKLTKKSKELKNKLDKICPICNSINIMERVGICNKYHDFVCLECGKKWQV